MLDRSIGPDHQGLEAIDRPGERGGAWRLRDHVGLSGQVRLVHRSVSLEDCRVHGADLMREQDEFIANVDRGDVEIEERPIACPAVRDRRAPPGERLEHLGGPCRCGLLEGFAPGEHERDDARYQPFPEDCGRREGEHAEQVGTEAGVDCVPRHPDDQRNADDRGHHDQRRIDDPSSNPESHEDRGAGDSHQNADGHPTPPGTSEHAKIRRDTTLPW